MENTWFKRKKYIVSGFFILMIILALATNPTTESYINFIENKTGVKEYSLGKENRPIPIEIERINFYIFSTYTPVIYTEYGVTHLGIFGKFIEISRGQFHYPKWLELFN